MPMLERIAGNRELKQDLKTALGSGRIAHSILLVGEPGCGAGFAARCLAADYLYPNGGPHAEAVLRGQDTESIVVRGEGASGQIKVEAIRDARQNIQKSALSSDAEGRVLFIYGAQNLNGASANAMLKIMEEPPEGVMFLLTASSAAAVLPTIRSLFFAYAWMWPEQQVLLFFILPIKMKWMGIAAAAMWVLEFLTGNFASRVSLLFGIAGFLAFFGGEMFTTAKDAIVSYKRRKDWEKKINRK